jgi:hypothetical protein
MSSWSTLQYLVFTPSMHYGRNVVASIVYNMSVGDRDHEVLGMG